MGRFTATLIVLLGLFSFQLVAQQKESEQNTEAAGQQTVEKSAQLKSPAETPKAGEGQKETRRS